MPPPSLNSNIESFGGVEEKIHFEDFFVKRVFIVNLKQKYLHRQEAFRNINFFNLNKSILFQTYTEFTVLRKVWALDDLIS